MAGNTHLLNTPFTIETPCEADFNVRITTPNAYIAKNIPTVFHITGTYDGSDSHYLSLLVMENMDKLDFYSDDSDINSKDSDLDDAHEIANIEAIERLEELEQDIDEEFDDDAETEIPNSVGGNSQYLVYEDAGFLPKTVNLSYILNMESGDHSPNSVYFSYADFKTFVKNALELIDTKPSKLKSIKHECGWSPYKWSVVWLSIVECEDEFIVEVLMVNPYWSNSLVLTLENAKALLQRMDAMAEVAEMESQESKLS